MNLFLFGVAAVIAAALVGDGLRRAGRSLERRAETDHIAMLAEMGLIDDVDDDDDDEPEGESIWVTVH